MTFYTDGVLVSTLAYPAGDNHHDWMNLIFSTIAYGTAAYGGVPDPSQLPAQVDVDYVHFYQKNFYVDNSGPSSASYHELGTGWSDSSLPGFSNSSSRYAAAATGTAKWDFTPPATGTYKVEAWLPVNSSNSYATTYTVSHNGLTSSTTLDGRTGTSRWIQLGEYLMTKDQAQFAAVQAS